MHEFLDNQNLESYFHALETSKVRNEEKQQRLKLRRERTQRGYDQLRHMLSRPLNTPQIMYRETEYFLKVPFDNSRPIASDVESSSEHDRFATENGIDIQRHYRGFYAKKPFGKDAVIFDYGLAKLNEPYDCDRFFERPSGMYITMCYKGPFHGDCAPSYEIVWEYLKKHCYTPLTGMFVEVAVGPFYSRDPEEYIAELSLQIE